MDIKRLQISDEKRAFQTTTKKERKKKPEKRINENAKRIMTRNQRNENYRKNKQESLHI